VSRLIRLLRWLNLGLVLATLLCYLAPYVSPARFWPLSFLGLLYPWLLLGNLFFIIGWLARRKYYFIFSLGCVVLGWGHVQSYVGFSRTAPAEADAFRLMSFNTHGFQDHRQRNKRLDLARLPEELPLEGLDLVCFQEFPLGERGGQIAKYVQGHKVLKHGIFQTGGGMALFSRYPILAHHTHYFPNRANGYQYADLKIGQQTVRLFNVHLQSSSVASIADHVVESGNLKEKETWLFIGRMMKRYKRAAVIRASQAEEVAAKIRESPYPVLLCGDFNEIPQSYAYRILSAELQDAFKARGRGLAVTYVGKIPGLRIDYVLAGPELEILSHQIGKRNFSDHLPVYSTMRWQE
jgi:endonuclease/exonuclease/phosphatase family metal-dependent hydrolase